MRCAEHRARHEVAAHEPEHVAVARVAAGDPRAIAVRHPPDHRQEIEHETEDAGPAMRDGERPPDELGDERLERTLDGRSRLLVRRELRVEGEVAEASRENPAV